MHPCQLSPLLFTIPASVTTCCSCCIRKCSPCAGSFSNSRPVEKNIQRAVHLHPSTTSRFDCDTLLKPSRYVRASCASCCRTEPVHTLPGNMELYRSGLMPPSLIHLALVLVFIHAAALSSGTLPRRALPLDLTDSACSLGPLPPPFYSLCAWLCLNVDLRQWHARQSKIPRHSFENLSNLSDPNGLLQVIDAQACDKQCRLQ